MNIKVPNGMKNPTVVIVGNNQPDDRKNEMVSKRMDLLEKSLDNQYKAFQNHKDYLKVIESLQKSFMDKLEKIILSSSSNREAYEKRLETVRREFSDRIKDFKSPNTSDELLKTFTRKLTSLETSIKSIPTVQKEVRIIRNGNNPSLQKSFESMFTRLEATIMKARPKLTPMPM